MSDTRIVALYATRKYTIRQLASISGKSYEEVRRIIANAGYQYGKLI